jgi:hypothetical protein
MKKEKYMSRKKIPFSSAFLLLPFLLAACAPAVIPESIRTATTTGTNPGEQATPMPEVSEPQIPPTSAETGNSTLALIDPTTEINERVDDPNNYGYSQLLPWDAIRPVYDPTFTSASEAPLQDEELVMGVTLDGESKAYPVTVLRFREMVDDELAGWPILVTW